MEKIKVGFLGVGYYVPPKVLTNPDLEKMVDTTDEWITTRTGIKERRIAGDDIAIILGLQHQRIVSPHRVAAIQHPPQMLGPTHHHLGMAGEEVEEALLARQDATEQGKHRGHPLKNLAAAPF